MTDRNRNTDVDSDAAFEALLKKSPPRAAPPPGDEAAIRAAVQEEWQRVTGRVARRRRFTSLAIAASVLVAVFATLNLLRDPVPAFDEQVVATAAHAFGEVRLVEPGGASTELAASIVGSGGFAIGGLDVVETGPDSGLALDWHGGGSLRLDANTRVVFEAQDRVFLARGRVYFDSVANPVDAYAANAGPADFALRTGHGMLRHLGTQYMTSVRGDVVSVAVREGSVTFAGSGVSARAAAGQQVIIEAGSADIEAIDGYGDAWAWVERTSPAVDLDGRLVLDALRWVSRESGRTLEFRSAEAERLAGETELRGLQGRLRMEPTRALELFMLTVDLEAQVDGGRIVISEAGPQ